MNGGPEWTCPLCGASGTLMDSLFHDCMPDDPEGGSAGVPAWRPPSQDPPALSRERELVGASS